MPRTERQLDLFRRAEVKLFPFDRRPDLYLPLVRELLALPLKADRDRLWRTRMLELACDLQDKGMPHDEIRRELDTLRTKVGCEVRRQIHLAILRGEMAL